ncbi:MAG TPA: hypothetical protein VGQ51_00755 [Puia sp.]|jgi:ferric-dicitrate binding protein FerR (iron transport regulator)|nr:hypothetical protein [Puia sp.]
MGKIVLAGWIVIALVAAGCRNGAEKDVPGGKEYQNETQSKQRIRLPDSSTVILAPGAKIQLGNGFDSGIKELSLDGEAWFDIIRGRVTLHTRDMVVEVLWAGRFHAEAFRARPGEEIDLLEGRIRAKKSYHSDTDNEEEELGPGEMVMINRDIDLMEKEKLNAAELEKLKGAW